MEIVPLAGEPTERDGIMKETFVNQLSTGRFVEDIFVARDKQLAHKKNGEPYLTFRICDRTGEVKAVVWDDVEAKQQQLASGDFVRISGKVNTYNGTLQIVVSDIRAIEKTENLLLEDFLPSTGRDIDGMYKKLCELADSVEEPQLAKLLASFFQDEVFVEHFKKAPAAKKMHHAYIGGLLEHTLSIATLAHAVSTHYKGLKRDLLLTGAILHDIGKVYEFSFSTHIDYSDAGRLLSHIVIGTEMLEKKIQSIESFPEELTLLVKHMIVSHHGLREFGSPQPPMTLEAIVLNLLDDLDAKVTGVRTFMEQQDPTEAWTSYHKVMERFFFKGTTNEESDNHVEPH